MDPAKVEQRTQKWNGWWQEKQGSPNAGKHYETYRRQMEKVGQTPMPYTPGAAPSAPGSQSGMTGRDDERERSHGKRKD